MTKNEEYRRRRYSYLTKEMLSFKKWKMLSSCVSLSFSLNDHCTSQPHFSLYSKMRIRPHTLRNVCDAPLCAFTNSCEFPVSSVLSAPRYFPWLVLHGRWCFDMSEMPVEPTPIIQQKSPREGLIYT
jgi:hypothetical protein